MRMTSEDLRSLIRLRYPSPEWAYFPEARNGTGFGRVVRTADALVMGLYPSRGMPVIGFEIKVSRGDWVRELRAPDKAEEIARFCDQWYLVVPDEKLVQAGELPASWGLMLPASKGDKLRIVTEAKQQEAQPLNRRFVGALVRRLGDVVPLSEVEARVSTLLATKLDELRASAEYRATESEKRYADLMKSVNEFHAASGVDLRHAWNIGKIGEAVYAVVNGQDERLRERLKTVRRVAEEITRAIDSLDAGDGEEQVA
jgi:hypothetical protein